MKTFKSTVAILALMGFLATVFVQFSFAEGKDGKTIFEDAKCAACHSVTAASIEAKKKSDKVPDLSTLTADKDLEFFTKYMKKDEVLNGKKHPVPFKGSDEDLKIMLEWLMSLKAETK
ncbi:hypothetical protein MASR1M45_06690 [Candidatus Kapaibacterium sp.]